MHAPVPDAAPGLVLRARAHRALLLSLIPITLTLAWAGLRPALDYSNSWVGVDEATGAFRFEQYGLAHGSVPDSVSEASRVPDFRIELALTLRPASDARFQVIAQLDAPGSRVPLILGQWDRSIIALNSRDFANRMGLPRVSANLGEYEGETVRVVVTFGPERTRIDANGRFAADGDPFAFGAPLERITLGNTPDGRHGWEGTLASFDLVAGPEGAPPAASYAFDTASSERVDDRAAPDRPLVVPPPGRFPDRAHLGRMGLRQLLEQNLRDVIVNFLGFGPLGFAIAGLLRTRSRPVSRSASVLVATAIGAAASTGIETAQLYIPGRSPHLHDLALNATGTLVGAIGFLALAAAIGSIVGRRRDGPGTIDREAAPER